MSKCLDEKQEKLIRAWHNKAQESYETQDYYSGFISIWIAFNAYCYGKFYDQAFKKRADISNSLPKDITEGDIEGYINVDEQKIKLTIEVPTKIVISIKERYTEDLIYDCFAKDFEQSHTELLSTNDEYRESIKKLKESLRKGDRFYIINMANIQKYNSEDNINTQAGNNVLVLLEDEKITTLRRVLYQIRCNIFHGEKLPGNVNDDRIVQAAYPIIHKIMDVIVSSLKISH